MFLTHHHQSDFSHVDTRRLLDFTLVGGCVRDPRTRDGDGSVTLGGVSCEPEPGGDAGVAVPVRLAPRVR